MNRRDRRRSDQRTHAYYLAILGFVLGMIGSITFGAGLATDSTTRIIVGLVVATVGSSLYASILVSVTNPRSPFKRRG